MNRNRASSDVALYIAASDQDLWRHAALPWFERVLPLAWQMALPSIVLVPARSAAMFLREQLIAAGKSHLGVRFVTPHVLRDLLGTGAPEPMPAREDLRLLLAIAAEQTLDTENEAVRLAVKSVVRAPDHLLRAIDRFEIAGWQFDRGELSAFAPIARQFRELLREHALQLIGEHDRALARNAAKQPKSISHVLIAGFDAGHWPLWHLLQAALGAAEHATVLLKDPLGCTAAETCWIGSWEERLGEAERVDAPAHREAESLFTEAEMRGAPAAKHEVVFLVGEDALQQARAVAQCCVRFVAQPLCTRVIVAFPAAGALPRLVSQALTDLGTPHNDAFAHPLPGIFESPEWRAWIELQRAPRIGSLVALFSALPQIPEPLAGIPPEKLERVLRDLHGELLIDDLDVLREACAASRDDNRQVIANVLGALTFLPARATFGHFASRTEAALKQLGWEQHRIELANRAQPWMQQLDAKMARASYLRWLEETAASFGAERTPVGDHPYARVQLLTIPDAQGQHCSHLILAGSNDGVWPPPASSEFAREQAIDAFNANAQQLNRRAVRQGWQGEGHTTIRDGHTFYLGPREQRAIAQQQIESLLDRANVAVAFAASLVQEDTPERLWNPSELFTRTFQQTNGRALTREVMLDLNSATARCIETRKAIRPANNIEETRVAYAARRDSSGNSNEYDFAFHSEPPLVPTLSVSDFEKLISAPAIVWLRRYVGVEPPQDDAHLWATSSGKWVHDWLAAIAGAPEKTFARLPSAAEIDGRICAAAEQMRAVVGGACRAAGKMLPDWWKSGWQNALFISRALGEKLAEAAGWPWIATEWKLDDDAAIEVSKTAALLFRGRIDLVLAREELPAGSLSADQLWIVDYKTGAKKALGTRREDADKRRPSLRRKLLDGSALQLGLYSFAAQQLGARETWASLLSPVVRPFEPQVRGTQIAGEADIFEELARMQQTGRFGMHGLLRSAYRFVEEYPLATVPIDQEIIEERWRRMHPPLAKEEEEW